MVPIPLTRIGRIPFAAAMLCASLTAGVRVAHADLITQSSEISSVDGTITFNYLPKDYLGGGPIQVGSEIGEDIVWSSSNPRAVANYTDYYGLGDNGYWQRDDNNGFIGVNREDVAMLLTFNSGPVSEVGGFLNYGPEIGWDAFFEVYDKNGRLLESYNLPYDAPISTPATRTAARSGESNAALTIFAMSCFSADIWSPMMSFSIAAASPPSRNRAPQ